MKHSKNNFDGLVMSHTLPTAMDLLSCPQTAKFSQREPEQGTSVCKNKKTWPFQNSQRGGGLDIPSKTLLDLLEIKIKLWCKPPCSPQGIWSCQSQSAEEQILALLPASAASSRLAVCWASTHYGRLCLNWAAKSRWESKSRMHCRAWQEHLAVLGKHPLDTSGHWGWTEPLCRHTDHTLNHQRKAGFYQRHPTLPKPAWESSTHTHTHTPKCQFRMAQAVKKSVQSNENHLEQWEPVSSLYFANAMLSFPSNSKLSLHANAIFPCPFPRCNLFFSPAWSTPRRCNGMGIILYHTSIFHWFQHAVQ